MCEKCTGQNALLERDPTACLPSGMLPARTQRGIGSVLRVPRGRGWGVGEAMVLVCVPLAVPTGLSPLLILPERVLVVSTEPPDDLSCLTTPGVGRPGDGLLFRKPRGQICHQGHDAPISFLDTTSEHHASQNQGIRQHTQHRSRTN